MHTPPQCATTREAGRRRDPAHWTTLRAAHFGAIGCDMTSAARNCQSAPQLRCRLGSGPAAHAFTSRPRLDSWIRMRLFGDAPRSGAARSLTKRCFHPPESVRSAAAGGGSSRHWIAARIAAALRCSGPWPGATDRAERSIADQAELAVVLWCPVDEPAMSRCVGVDRDHPVLQAPEREPIQVVAAHLDVAQRLDQLRVEALRPAVERLVEQRTQVGFADRRHFAAACHGGCPQARWSSRSACRPGLCQDCRHGRRYWRYWRYW